MLQAPVNKDQTEVIHGAGGTMLKGDAILMYQACVLEKNLEMKLKFDMFLSRNATVGGVLAAISAITKKKYKTSKKDQHQAVKDIRVWIDTIKASIPVTNAH